MQNNCIKDLLDLKDVIVKKVENLKDCVKVHIELPVIEQICPCCGTHTSYVHDYYTQTIKDIPIHFKPTYLIFRKRRYTCPSCGKKFFELNSIISKYSRKTSRLTQLVIHELRNLVSQWDVSKRTNVSTSIISKMLPYLAVSNSSLPRVLCIDEYKGNAGSFKYQVALINGETHEVVDILECRHKHFLCDYFKKFPQQQLDNVKFLVTDLWEPYKDIGITYFRKAKIVADHFHVARFICQAVNDIRIQVQKNLPKSERIYFKHSRKLLLSRQLNLKNANQKDELSYILINYSEELRIAYREKEDFLNIIHSQDPSQTKATLLSDWIKRNLDSPIKQLSDCAKTYQHWFVEIKHSLEVPYSNGPIEGFNNKIKVLKRVSFGMRSFNNMKARILLLNRQ